MDRRNFISTTGMASAAILTSASLFGFNSNSTINVGIIGTGGRGVGLIGIVNNIEGMNIVACCDTLPFRLQEGLAKCAIKAKGYSDYKKLLDNKDIDAVIIAAPFGLHFEMAMDAIDAGKHIYCEKTTVKGYEAVQQLVQKVKGSKQIFQTGHQYHSSRMYSKIVELINDGMLGSIAAFDCQWNRFTDWRKPVPDPSLERKINWRLYKELSGGLPAELSSHQIDFVNWVLNATPEKVMGMGGIDYWKDGRETFDNTHLMYQYPDGIKAKFTSINCNKKDGYQIKVIGERGTLLIQPQSASFIPQTKDVKKDVKKADLKDVDGYSGATEQLNKAYAEAINVEHLEPTLQALMDFKESIISNKQPLSNVITGGKTAICVQMGLDAMYNDEIVHWKPEYNL